MARGQGTNAPGRNVASPSTRGRRSAAPISPLDLTQMGPRLSRHWRAQTIILNLCLIISCCKWRPGSILAGIAQRRVLLDVEIAIDLAGKSGSGYLWGNRALRSSGAFGRVAKSAHES